MMELEEVKNAKAELESIENAQKEFNNNIKKEIYDVEKKYSDEIDECNKRRREEVKNVEDDGTHINEKYEANKENSLQIISEYDKIITFLQIQKKYRWRSVSSPLVYKYDYLRDENGRANYSADKVKVFYNPIDILVNNDFVKIYLYITENDKPINSYSLTAVGITKFNDKVFKDTGVKIPYDYGACCHTENANIRYQVKDLPREEELKGYLKRNKAKILKSFIEEHNKQELLFTEITKEVGDSEEWKLAVLEKEKDYYENSVSRGTETKEYKDILSRIEEIKDGM